MNVFFGEVLDSAIVSSIALQIVNHIRSLLLLVEAHVPAESECAHAHGAEDCNDDHDCYQNGRHVLHRIVEVVHLHLNLSRWFKISAERVREESVSPVSLSFFFLSYGNNIIWYVYNMHIS